jgi:cytoskeletal protein CcmA (bactofilin family)
MLDQRVDGSSPSAQDQFLQVRPGSTAKSSVAAVSSQSMIGKSLIIKGEITGTESVHIEGTVEGSILLPDDRVTVGPSGRVSADITAQDVVVQGELTGSCDATDHLYVRRGGSFCGDIVTARISVEDGAYLTGTVDIRRESTPVPSTPEQESAEPEPAEQELLEPAHVN